VKKSPNTREIKSLVVNAVALVDDPANMSPFYIIKRRNPAEGGNVDPKTKKPAVVAAKKVAKAFPPEEKKPDEGMEEEKKESTNHQVVEGSMADELASASEATADTLTSFVEFLSSATRDPATGLVIIPGDQYDAVQAAADAFMAAWSKIHPEAEAPIEEPMLPEMMAADLPLMLQKELTKTIGEVRDLLSPEAQEKAIRDAVTEAMKPTKKAEVLVDFDDYESEERPEVFAGSESMNEDDFSSAAVVQKSHRADSGKIVHIPKSPFEIEDGD
jgi:hypothetical protein